MVDLVTDVTWKTSDGQRFASFEAANKVEAEARLRKALADANVGFQDEIAAMLMAHDQIAKAAYDYHFAAPTDDQAAKAVEVSKAFSAIVVAAAPVEESPALGEVRDADAIPRLPG